MLNIVALQGRLAADPEQRTTQNGTPVTSFSLAVQRNVKGGDGEYGIDWIDCVAWKGTAEFICKYFQKGHLMAVTATWQSATAREPRARNGRPPRSGAGTLTPWRN